MNRRRRYHGLMSRWFEHVEMIALRYLTSCWGFFKRWSIRGFEGGRVWERDGVEVNETTYHSLFRFRPTIVDEERLFALGSRPFCCNDRSCVRRNKISRSCSWSITQICSSALLTGFMELSMLTVWTVWDMSQTRGWGWARKLRSG